MHTAVFKHIKGFSQSYVFFGLLSLSVCPSLTAPGHPGPHNCWGAEEHLRGRARKAGVVHSLCITSVISWQAWLKGLADPREQELTPVTACPTLQDHSRASEEASLPWRSILTTQRWSDQTQFMGSHGSQHLPAALLLPAPGTSAFQHHSPLC